MFGQKRLAYERGEGPAPMWDLPSSAGMASVLIGSVNVIAYLGVERWNAICAGGVCLAALMIALAVAGKSHHDRWLIRSAIWIGIIAGAVLVPTGLIELAMRAL